MTGRPGPTPEDFADLRHIGDQLEGEIRDSFLRMVSAAEQYAGQFAGTPNMLELIRSGNTAALQAYAERLLSQGLIPNSLEFMNLMFVIMLRAGNATLASTSLTLPVRDSVLETIRFFSMRRGREVGGQWVTNVSLETVRSMRNIMADAIKRGVGAEQLGRELRSSIGLLPDHKDAWDNYNALLRDRGVSEKTYNRLSRMYHRRLLSYRAEMIARTETMFAVHAGMMEGWVAQIRHGLIQPERTWIEWVVTEDDRLCDRCAPMDGERVRFGKQFVATERGFPDGKPPYADSPYDRRMRRRGPLKPKIPVRKGEGELPKLKKPISVYHPPLHPNCRCTLRLRFET